ncbi:DnaJ sub B member 13 [Gonapodya sp. JEL0774]|nr:DnaJ sub B member 13 [Gonapodya sp. JEL0774]
MSYAAHTDYYKALNVTKDADVEAIRRAYRKLALKHHPDKDPSQISRSIFSISSEAYEVLSDAKLRAIYDQHGSDGLLHGVLARDRYDEREEGDSAVGFEGFTGGWKYHGLPEKTFEMFVGGGSPYKGHVPPKPGPIILPLPLTLAQMHTGTVRVLSYSRLVLSADASTTHREPATVRVEVAPGWRAGTRATFPGQGDAVVGGESGDVIVVVEGGKEDGRWREGDDLVVEREVGLLEGLCGSVVEVETMDGRSVRVAVGEVVR